MFGVNYVLGQAIIDMNIEPGFTVGRLDQGGIVLCKSQAVSGRRMQIHQWPRMKPPQGGDLPAGGMEKRKQLAAGDQDERVILGEFRLRKRRNRRLHIDRKTRLSRPLHYRTHQLNAPAGRVKPLLFVLAVLHLAQRIPCSANCSKLKPDGSNIQRK